MTRVSVIIPARNEAPRIARTIAAVQPQAGSDELEIVVVDDGSSDGTGAAAERAGARVISLGSDGNPGRARNAGARIARGGILLFLDADCTPCPGWLSAHCEAQSQGHRIVGGALALAPGLPWTARADYYVSAYHVHPGRASGPVPHHSPANLSVERAVFERTRGFAETLPVADGHEELSWMGEAAAAGVRPWFEPGAVAEHVNRPGWGNLLRRSYRWGYSAVEAKAVSRTARLGFWYRIPVLPIIGAYPLALLETVYIWLSWLMAGRWSVTQFLPAMLLSRLAYATGVVMGGSRWLMRPQGQPGVRPQWR